MEDVVEKKKDVSISETFKNMNPEQKEGLGSFIINSIISIIIVLIIGSILYFRYNSLFTPEEVSQLQSVASGLSGWGIMCLIFTFVFYIIGILTFLHYRKRYKAGEITKDVSTIIFRILICSACALMASWTLLSLADIWYSIYVYALAFGCCWIFFQVFSSMKYKTFKRWLWFPLALVFRFFIPMLLVFIILLGVLNGLYPHDSVFLNDVKQVFGTDTYTSLANGGSLGMIIGYVCYTVVSSLYLLGSSRPEFMLILCILITLFLLYRAIKKHFIEGVPPMSFVDVLTEKELKEYDAIEEANMDKTSEQIKAEIEAKEKLEEEAEKKAEENFEVKLY